MADKRVGMMCRVEPAYRENVRRLVAAEAARRGDPDFTLQKFLVEAITHRIYQFEIRYGRGEAQEAAEASGPANCAKHEGAQEA